MSFQETFCQQDHACDLRPLRDDVADDLSPLGCGIGFGKQPNPADAGQYKKNCQRVAVDSPHDGSGPVLWRASTFRGANLVEKLRGEDRDEESGPIGDGVAEEGSPVRGRIGTGVENDPRQEDDCADDTERVTVQKALSALSWHAASMPGFGAGLLSGNTPKLNTEGTEVP